MIDTVSVIGGKRDQSDRDADRMKARIGSEEGRAMIAARFATIEPVLGNLRYNKRLNRFTLRVAVEVDVHDA